MKFFVVITVVVLIFSPVAFATERWWQRSEEGWYFYKETKKPKTEKKKEEKKETTQVKPSSAPNMLFIEKMRQKERILLSRALENPTEENLKAYMEHNKKVLELSQKFTVAWQKVLMKESELNYNVRERDVNVIVKNVISKLRDTAGLYFFYSGTCDLCRLQAEQLIEFSEKHDFAILPISVDGTVLPQFPNTKFDNGITERLGVKKVPAIFIVFPKERKIDPISFSYISAFDLERRLVYYAEESVSAPIFEEDDNFFDSTGSHTSSVVLKN